MNDGVILDVLLVLVVLLYVPIAALRGGLRETILGGAILLGGVLAASRAERWGHELAELTGFGRSTSAFLVAVGCIFGSALILGIGGSALCDRRVPSLGGRALGALVGGLNAVVAITLTLRAYETLALGGERRATLAGTFFARNLIDRFDLVVLAVAGILLGGVVAGHLLHRVLGVSYDTDIEPALTWVQSTQRPARSIRIPAQADAGKVEPHAVSDRTAHTFDDVPAVRWVEPVPISVDRAAPNGSGGTVPHWRDIHESRPDAAKSTHPRRDDDVTIIDQWLRRGHADDSEQIGEQTGILERDPGLAELHRLLHMDAMPETPEPTNVSFDDRSIDDSPRSRRIGQFEDFQEESIYSADRPGRCLKCDTLLPDPSLPCPFCDDR